MKSTSSSVISTPAKLLLAVYRLHERAAISPVQRRTAKELILSEDQRIYSLLDDILPQANVANKAAATTTNSLDEVFLEQVLLRFLSSPPSFQAGDVNLAPHHHCLPGDNKELDFDNLSSCSPSPSQPFLSALSQQCSPMSYQLRDQSNRSSPENSKRSNSSTSNAISRQGWVKPAFSIPKQRLGAQVTRVFSEKTITAEATAAGTNSGGKR